jgi:hypothetical protein
MGKFVGEKNDNETDNGSTTQQNCLGRLARRARGAEARRMSLPGPDPDAAGRQQHSRWYNQTLRFAVESRRPL